MNRKRVRDEDLALLRAKVPKLCRTSWTFGSRCAQPTRTAMVKWVHFFVCVRPKMWVTIHQVDIINDNLDHIILRWPAIKRQATLGGFFRIFLPALASILSISFIPQCGRICLGLGRPNFFVCHPPGILSGCLLQGFLRRAAFSSFFLAFQIDADEWCHMWDDYAKGNATWQNKYMEVIFALHDISGSLYSFT